jgi:hypothetical protein
MPCNAFKPTPFLSHTKWNMVIRGFPGVLSRGECSSQSHTKEMKHLSFPRFCYFLASSPRLRPLHPHPQLCVPASVINRGLLYLLPGKISNFNNNHRIYTMRSAFTSLAASASVAGNHGHSSASASSVAGTSIPALPRNNLNQFGMSLFGNLKTDIEKMQQNIVSEDESRDHLFKMVR